MKKIYLLVYSACIFTIAYLIYLVKAIFMKNEISDGVRRVLVIRTDAIGDFVLWRPFGLSLCEYYSKLGFPVDYLANEYVANSLLVKGLASNVISFDKKLFQSNISYVVSLIELIRRHEYSYVIAPQYSRFIGSSVYLILLICRSSYKIGISAYKSNSSIPQLVRNFLDACILDKTCGSNEKILHEINRNSAFLSSIGISHNYSNSDIGSINETLNAEFLRPYVILFPGGSTNEKCWPAPKFDAIAKFLNEKGFLVIVCGSMTDSPNAHGITFSDSVLNYIGRGDLDFFINLIKKSSLVVTNDTVAVHLSAALKVKSLALMWGAGGDYGRFLPYSENLQNYYQVPRVIFKSSVCDFKCRGKCKHICSNGRARCINEISVCEVIKSMPIEFLAL